MHVVLAGPSTPPLLRDLVGLDDEAFMPPGLGGTPVNALARALVEHGHRVTLVTLSPGVGQPWRADGPALSVLALPWRSRPRDRARDFFRAERRWVARGVTEAGGDVVHAHWTYEYACGALASRRPTLVTVHDAPWTILRHHHDAYRAVRFAMASRVRVSSAALCAVSPYAAARWQREMWDRRRIDVVPNIAPALTGGWERRDDGRHVVMVGSADPLKNIATGIEAFAQCRRSHPDLMLSIAGSGLESSGEFARAYEREGVSFLGPLATAELHDLLGRATVVVHPSLEETQGMVLLEAMRAGAPVIAGRNSGGVAWTLGDGSAGLLVDVTDVLAMSSAMSSLLADPARAASYATAGERLLDERFSAAVVTKQYVDLYDRL